MEKLPANTGARDVIPPRHHSNDHLNGQSGLVDTAAKGWYRYLVDLHAIGGTEEGIKGYEDSVWEAGHPKHAPGTTAHNVYLGYDASHGAGDLDKGNVSSFCGAAAMRILTGRIQRVRHGARSMPHQGLCISIESGTRRTLTSRIQENMQAQGETAMYMTPFPLWQKSGLCRTGHPVTR